MSLTVKPKVSSVVQYQVPEFIKNDNPLFPEFLAHYYKFLEQENQSLDVIRKTVDNLNVDRTSDQFLELIKSHVLPYNLNNAEAIVPDEMLIKYLRELYVAKGTEKSYEFVFNNLYNADIEMQYGKNFVFRSSDNEYPGFDSIILQDKVNNTILLGLAGNVISQPKGSAIVDKVELYNNPLVAATFAGSISLNSPIVRAVSTLTGLKVGSIISDTLFALPKDTQIISINTLTNELTLSAPARSSHVNYTLYAKDAYYVCLLKSNITRGDFDPELPVSGTINTVGISLDVITSVNSVSVTTGGALYKSGQRLNVIGGSGQHLLVEIDEVGPGGVEDVYIAQGGTGYAVGNIITFDDPTGKGVGAKAVVAAIDGHGAKLTPIMTIDAINKINGGYGYAVNDVISLDLPAIDGTKPKLIVNSVTSNILSAVNVTSGGHGYQYARAMFYVNGTNYWVTTPTISNTILKTIPLPIPAVTATPTLYINGSGCSGSLTVSAKIITALTITTPGFNYVRPKIEIYADAGFVTKLEVTAPRLEFTLNVWSGVTAITLYDIIDIANGIYYYKVVEANGQGATASLFMGGAILTASINTNKLFSSVNYKVAFVPTTDYVGLGRDASFYLSYKVNSINLAAGGARYNSPTYTLQGTGSGFIGTIIVSAGLISAVVVVAPGEGYPQTSTIAITTSTGLAAVLTPVINDLGQVVSVKITNAGTLYNASNTIAIVSGQTEATLNLTVTNGSVTAVATTTAGNYSRTPTVTINENLATDYGVVGCSGVAGAFTITTSGSFVNVKPGHRIYGEGDALFLQNVVVASVISLTQITIDRPSTITFGSQFLNFKISRGSISKIEVLQSGYGYTSLPNVVLPVQSVGSDPNLINAKLIPLSSTIGHIKSFRVINQGINYEQRPLLTTPMVAITTSLDRMFSLNELVIDPDFVYPGGNYALGPHGYVAGIDSSKNIVYLENATDNFVFTLESGLGLATESGNEIIHESSFLLDHSASS